MSAERFRTLVSTVLLAGVLLSATLLIVGLAGALAVGWDGSLTGAPPVPPSDPTDFSGVLTGLADLRPIAIAQAGLLVLVLTPVVRVAASAVAFGLERDGMYTAITLAVLAILLVSLFGIR